MERNTKVIEFYGLPGGVKLQYVNIFSIVISVV